MEPPAVAQTLTSRLRAALRIIDFIVSLDVITAVFVIFALENALDYYVTVYFPNLVSGPFWVIVAAISLMFLNIAAADEEEMDDLRDDIDDL